MRVQVGQLGPGHRQPVGAAVVPDRQPRPGTTRDTVAATRPAKHQLVSATAIEAPGHRSGNRLGHRHRPDARVALGPVLVARPEPAGVIAHVDDLDPPGIQVDAPCSQAEQLPTAEAGADLDDEVVPVEDWAGDQEPTELLGGVGPPPDPAEHDLGVHRPVRGTDLPYRVDRDQPLTLGRRQDAVQDRPAGHRQVVAGPPFQLVLPPLHHLRRDRAERSTPEVRANVQP
jgi:hypothetical protein